MNTLSDTIEETDQKTIAPMVIEENEEHSRDEFYNKINIFISCWIRSKRLTTTQWMKL